MFMMDLNFKTWLEYKDIFGFEKEREVTTEKIIKEDPLKVFSIEKLMQSLAYRDLNGKSSYLKFIGEVIWGEHVGAVRVKIGPSYYATVDKLCKDLEGNAIWVTKRFYQINRAGFGGYEEHVAEKIYEDAKLVDATPLDRPISEYNDLQKLVISIAEKIKRVGKNIFIFDGITRVNPNNYIIRLGLTGHGVEARDHQRVIENLTDVSFDDKTGKIRIINTSVKSKVGGHFWKLWPADRDWNFLPSQPTDEIIDAVATTIRWY
jgi:hypothetical protein